MTDSSSATDGFTRFIDWKDTSLDALAVLREAYPEDEFNNIEPLHSATMDKLATMYANVPLEEGAAALGQELSHHGWALYSVQTGGDEWVFLLEPTPAKGTMPDEQCFVLYARHSDEVDDEDENEAYECACALQRQTGKKWGQKAARIKSVKLDLVADRRVAQADNTSLTLLDGRWVYQEIRSYSDEPTQPESRWVLDLERLNPPDSSPGVNDLHPLALLNLPTEYAGQFYSPVLTAAHSLRAAEFAFCLSEDIRYDAANRKGGPGPQPTRYHWVSFNADQRPHWRSFTLPTHYPPRADVVPMPDPPAKPAKGGLLQRLGLGRQAAATDEITASIDYHLEQLLPLPEGFALLCHTETPGDYDAPKQHLLLYCDRDMQIRGWHALPSPPHSTYPMHLARGADGTLVIAVGHHWLQCSLAPNPQQFDLSLALTPLPGTHPTCTGGLCLLDELPGDGPGPWVLVGSDDNQYDRRFVLYAQHLPSGRLLRRALDGMQPKLASCRYGQHIHPLLLPEGWVLLDIRGDNWGLADAAWLWHMPSDRCFALPLTAIDGAHKENCELAYNAALGCLVATTHGFDHPATLCRLKPLPDMLAEIEAQPALLRRLPDWMDCAEHPHLRPKTRDTQPDRPTAALPLHAGSQELLSALRSTYPEITELHAPELAALATALAPLPMLDAAAVLGQAVSQQRDWALYHQDSCTDAWVFTLHATQEGGAAPDSSFSYSEGETCYTLQHQPALEWGAAPATTP